MDRKRNDKHFKTYSDMKPSLTVRQAPMAMRMIPPTSERKYETPEMIPIALRLLSTAWVSVQCHRFCIASEYC